MNHWTEKFFVENGPMYAQELEEIDEWVEDEVADLLALASTEFDYTPTTVLDVGCGLGRHCLEFADAGFDVTGIDISPSFIRQARKRAETGGVANRTQFHKLDMRELDSLDETFDLVVCLYNTLGYFDSQTNIDVLRQMRKRLSPNGMCVIQVPNKDTVLTDFQSTVIHEHDFGVIMAQHDFDTQTSRMTITRDVLSGNAPDFEYDGRNTYDVQLYSPPELEYTVFSAGFADVTLFGGYGGTDPSLDRGQLVVFAQ